MAKQKEVEQKNYKLNDKTLDKYWEDNRSKIEDKYSKKARKAGLKLTEEQKSAGIKRILVAVGKSIDSARESGHKDVSDFYMNVFADGRIFIEVQAQPGNEDSTGKNIMAKTVIPGEGQTAISFLNRKDRESIIVFAREKSRKKGLHLSPPGVKQIIREGLSKLDKQVESARKANIPMQLGTFYISAERGIHERIKKLSEKKK